MDPFPERAGLPATLYRFGLRLYSPHFRQRFGEEMLDIFHDRMRHASSQGRLASLSILVNELWGLFAGGLRQRLYARHARAALAGGGAALLDGDALPWYAIKRLLKAVLPLLFILLAFRACRAVYFITFDEALDVRHVALGDVNGDGRPDAFLSLGSIGDGYWRADRLLLNQRSGRLFDSGQDFGEWRSFSAAVGDVTGDGLADVVSGDYAGLRLYRNQGYEPFTATDYFPSTMGTLRATDLNVSMADLNGDGWQDVFVAACCGGWIGADSTATRKPYSEVWLNDGAGRLASNGQQIGQWGANAVALGDLNGDGAADAILANGKTVADHRLFDGSMLRAMGSSIGLDLGSDGIYVYKTPNTVWFNDGQGTFSRGAQRLGQAETLGVALGDLDGDSDLDLVVGNHGPDEVWFNDGEGNFVLSPQALPGRQVLGHGTTWSVDLIDFDGDGDLDLLAGGETGAHIWLNDGAGRFYGSQNVRMGRYQSIAAGDLSGDGIPDLLVAGADSYRIWRGRGDGRFIAGKAVDYRAPKP